MNDHYQLFSKVLYRIIILLVILSSLHSRFIRFQNRVYNQLIRKWRSCLILPLLLLLSLEISWLWQGETLFSSFIHRLSIYRDFLSTEYNYIRDLEIISEVYEEPFLNDLKKKSCLLNEHEIRVVFCNYKDILKVK